MGYIPCVFLTDYAILRRLWHCFRVYIHCTLYVVVNELHGLVRCLQHQDPTFTRHNIPSVTEKILRLWNALIKIAQHSTACLARIASHSIHPIHLQHRTNQPQPRIKLHQTPTKQQTTVLITTSTTIPVKPPMLIQSP